MDRMDWRALDTIVLAAMGKACKLCSPPNTDTELSVLAYGYYCSLKGLQSYICQVQMVEQHVFDSLQTGGATRPLPRS